MLPRVVLYNATSVDGRMDWIAPDLGQFYEMASRWKEDATLVGSNTLLAAELPEEEAPQLGDSDPSRPLLVVPDSRGRVRNLHLLRSQPYWRDAVALCSHSTPADYLDYLKKQGIDHILAGDDHVDFREALEELNSRYGVKVVRVDSGGTLNGVLLRAGLVDEVSLFIDPILVGGTTPRSLFIAPDLPSSEDVIRLRLTQLERLEGDVVWLCYEVVN